MNADDTTQKLLRFWFFKELTDDQRLRLFQVFEMPTDGVTTLGHQTVLFDRWVSALLPAQTEPDAGRVEAYRQGVRDAVTLIHEQADAFRAASLKAVLNSVANIVGNRLKPAVPDFPTPPSPPREEIEHQGVVAVGVKG